jgi:hypothetical protein
MSVFKNIETSILIFLSAFFASPCILFIPPHGASILTTITTLGELKDTVHCLMISQCSVLKLLIDSYTVLCVSQPVRERVSRR